MSHIQSKIERTLLDSEPESPSSELKRSAWDNQSGPSKLAINVLKDLIGTSLYRQFKQYLAGGTKDTGPEAELSYDAVEYSFMQILEALKVVMMPNLAQILNPLSHSYFRVENILKLKKYQKQYFKKASLVDYAEFVRTFAFKCLSQFEKPGGGNYIHIKLSEKQRHFKRCYEEELSIGEREASWHSYQVIDSDLAYLLGIEKTYSQIQSLAKKTPKTFHEFLTDTSEFSRDIKGYSNYLHVELADIQKSYTKPSPVKSLLEYKLECEAKLKERQLKRKERKLKAKKQVISKLASNFMCFHHIPFKYRKLMPKKNAGGVSSYAQRLYNLLSSINFNTGSEFDEFRILCSAQKTFGQFVESAQESYSPLKRISRWISSKSDSEKMDSYFELYCFELSANLSLSSDSADSDSDETVSTDSSKENTTVSKSCSHNALVLAKVATNPDGSVCKPAEVISAH